MTEHTKPPQSNRTKIKLSTKGVYVAIAKFEQEAHPKAGQGETPPHLTLFKNAAYILYSRNLKTPLRTGKLWLTQQLADALVCAQKNDARAKYDLSRRTRLAIQTSVWAGGPCGAQGWNTSYGLGVPSA